jgi:signal transduction histidine kinase
MREVSRRVTAYLCRQLSAHGVSDDVIATELIACSGVDRRTTGYLSWQSFAEFLEKISENFGGSKFLEELGEQHLDAGSFNFVKRIARLIVSPRDIYWLGFSWLGPSLFPVLDDDFEELPSGELRLTLRIPEDKIASSAFFHVILGALRPAPRLVGQADAIVQMEIGEREAVYRIYPPRARTLMARLKHSLLPSSAIRETLRELSVQQIELRKSCQELSDANRHVARQAMRLEQLNEWGRKLARENDLELLGGTIVELIRASCRAAAAVDVRDTKTGARLFRWGDVQPGEPPLISRRVSTSRGLSAVIEVWKRGGRGADPDVVEILDSLISWIAIALDNAYAIAETKRDWLRLHREMEHRKCVEQERRKLELKLHQNHKLESLGLMAGGIAHDFNNVLVGIVGNVSSLLAELEQDTYAYELAERIELTSQRATELVAELLAYTGRAAFRFRRVDLAAIVRAEALLLRASIPEAIRLDVECAVEEPWIQADPSQIQRVLMNLVLNAAEAMGARPGSITIKTEVCDVSQHLLDSCNVVGNVMPGRYALLEVRDSGRGIDADTMARMFDPFFSTKLTGQGLGLASAVGIVRSHRGAVHVSSEVGAGSCFRVYLPVCAPGID